MRLQNELRKIGALGERTDAIANIGAVDVHLRPLRPIGGGKADLFEQALENCVQAPGTNVFDGRVDFFG